MRLIHLGHNAGFVSSGRGLFVRVGLPGLEMQARNAVRFAMFCNTIGVPSVQPHPDFPDVLATPYGAATIWPWIATVSRPVPWLALGEMLRAIHGEKPTGLAPSVRPKPETLIERRKALRGTRMDVLARRRLDLLTDELICAQAFAAGLPTSASHGDPYVSNILMTRRGPLLVDFDTSGIGPTLFDLVPVFVQNRRFGLPAKELREFLRGYGQDPREMPGFAGALRMRELGNVSYLMSFAGRLPRFRAELCWRLTTVDRGRAWTPLDELGPRVPVNL